MKTETYLFLIQLKAMNKLWFNVIIRSARANAKVLRTTLKSAKEHLTMLNLNFDVINPFELCKLVNSGELTELSFADIINDSSWLIFREMQKQRIFDQFDSVKCKAFQNFSQKLKHNDPKEFKE